MNTLNDESASQSELEHSALSSVQADGLPADSESVEDRLRSLIASSPMAPVQVLVVMICFTLNMIDGMDVLVLSYVAPVLAQEWSLNPNQVGWIFSTGLLGMTIGCLAIAPMADVIGRQRMLLVSNIVIAAGMLLSAFASSLTEILLYRAATGLGIGSLLPTMSAIATEFSNEKRRDLSVGFVQAGWPIGAIITGLFAAWLVPEYGWRTVFLGAAGISLLLAPVIAFAMPESLEFLGKRRPPGATQRINRLLARMRHAPIAEIGDPPHGGIRRIQISALFEKQFAASTRLLWLGILFGFMTLYTLISWVPSIAQSSGMPTQQAIYVGTFLNAGAFAGSTLIGWLAIWLGLKRIISVFFLCAVILLVSYVNLAMNTGAIFLTTFLIGVTVQGGFNGFYPVAARIYPTALRATGIGWAMGAGRIGAILGPLLAGYLIAEGTSTSVLFSLFAVPLLISALAVHLIPSKNVV